MKESKMKIIAAISGVLVLVCLLMCDVWDKKANRIDVVKETIFTFEVDNRAVFVKTIKNIIEDPDFGVKLPEYLTLLNKEKITIEKLILILENGSGKVKIDEIVLIDFTFGQVSNTYRLGSQIVFAIALVNSMLFFGIVLMMMEKKTKKQKQKQKYMETE